MVCIRKGSYNIYKGSPYQLLLPPALEYLLNKAGYYINSTPVPSASYLALVQDLLGFIVVSYSIYSYLFSDFA